MSDQFLSTVTDRAEIFQRKKPRSSRIRLHRALRVLDFPLARLIVILGLPIIFNGISLIYKNKLIQFWEYILELSIEWTDVPAKIVFDKAIDHHFLDVVIPYIDLTAHVPTNTQWWIGALFFLLLTIVSSLLPERMAPARYGLRILAIIQATALIYFSFWPSQFPHSVKEYTQSNLRLGLELMFFVPWIHALTYYIHGFKLSYNIALTTFTLLFLAIAFPLQYFAHALILYEGSLLWLPLLYIAFGLLLVIMAMISLFAWAMTWRH